MRPPLGHNHQTMLIRRWTLHSMRRYSQTQHARSVSACSCTHVRRASHDQPWPQRAALTRTARCIAFVAVIPYFIIRR